MHRVLLTGSSGYLGGTFLARWKEAHISASLSALVRTPEQVFALQHYQVEPVLLREFSAQTIKDTITSREITIVLHLFNAFDCDLTGSFIEALASVKKETGKHVHFIFTSGAKLFSEHAGAPTDRAILDTDPDLYDMQCEQLSDPSLGIMRQGVKANKLVIDTAEAHGVRAYIFAPCIVYGQGEGFGNQISIQTVAIVKAAQKLRKVFKTADSSPTWPVCHVRDNTGLYMQLLRKIVAKEDVGYGKSGYYLASSGSIAWDRLYRAMADALYKRGVTDDSNLYLAGPDDLARMGEALGCSTALVPVQLSGQCTFTAEHGSQIGWKAEFPPDHIVDDADREVGCILANLSN